MDSQIVDQPGMCDVFARASEYMPWPLVMVDRSFRLFHSNPIARNVLGIDPSHQADFPLSELVTEDSHEKLEQYFECCFASANFQEISPPHCCQFLAKHREIIEVEMQGKVIKDQGKLSLVLYLSDLSGNLQSGQTMLERDLWYRNILDNTGAMIYIKDVQGRYQFINRLFEETFDIEAGKICGQTDYDIFPQEMADRFRRIDEQVCLNGQTEKVQEVVPHADGLHHYISVKFPLYNLQGKLTGIAGISTDITEQLRAEQELKTAQAVQKLLYPESAPQVEGYDIAGRVSPAENVSGDYYDYIWLSPDRLVIAVGDVSGHGLGPALEMVETRSYLRAILRTEIRLDVAMECLNEFLYRDLRDSAFVTLFLAEIDFASNSFQYVGAGHQAELLKASGEHIRLNSTGLMLGIESKETYQCSSCYLLQPHDLLLMTTDGITEAMAPTGELFGYKKMVSLMHNSQNRTARDVVNKLIDTAVQFPEQAHQADDMTAVAVKRTS